MLKNLDTTVNNELNAGSAKELPIATESYNSNDSVKARLQELEAANQKLQSANQKLESANQKLQSMSILSLNKRIFKEYEGYKTISQIHKDLNIVSPTLSEFFDLFRQYGYIESVPCTKNILATTNIGDQTAKHSPRFNIAETKSLLETTKTHLIGTPESRLQLIAEIEAEARNAN